MVAARLYFVKEENSVSKAWLRARKKASKVRETNLRGAGMNKILRPEQHQAIYNTIGGRLGYEWRQRATKQMLSNCSMWLRVQDNKAALL
jgi:hypothetical protein